jgi:hypothetical protein
MEQFIFQTGRVTARRALLAAWTCWFVCFLVMPISTVFYGTFDTMILFVCANVALWLGLSFASSRDRGVSAGTEPRSYDKGDLRAVLLCLVAAGVIAIAAKLVDLVAYRDILSATSFSDGRLKMEVNGSNPFSGIHFLLSPAIAVGGILALVLLCKGLLRSLLIVAFSLVVISWLLIVPKISRRHIVFIGASVLVVFLLTMYLFVSRVVENVGVQVDRIAMLSDYTKLVPLDVDTIMNMRDLPDLGRFFLYYVTSVGQYVLHGVFEFFYLVQAKSPDQELLWGKYQFTLIGQAQRVIFGPQSVTDLEIYKPTSILFSTFWGPAYIDFGYLMVAYGFAFGYAAGRVGRLVERGDVFALPLYALFILQIFLVPIVNAVLMASAVVLNVGIFGIWLLMRWYLGRQAAAVNAVV